MFQSHIMFQKYKIKPYDQMCYAHEANLGIIVENQMHPKGPGH